MQLILNLSKYGTHTVGNGDDPFGLGMVYYAFICIKVVDAMCNVHTVLLDQNALTNGHVWCTVYMTVFHLI